MPDEPTWATAIVEPNRDFDADLRLRHDGFRVVLLAYRKRITGHNRPGWRTRCEFVARPLFPGYLFIQMEPKQAWPKQNGSSGFVGFLVSATSRQPLMLPHQTVSEWQGLMQSGAYDDVPPLEAQLAHRFHPANDPAERRRLFAARFAAMIDDWC